MIGSLYYNSSRDSKSVARYTTVYILLIFIKLPPITLCVAALCYLLYKRDKKQAKL